MTPEEFALLIPFVFNRNELLKLSSSLGLTFPGRRISSIPDFEIALAFVDEFYEDPEMGKEVIKILKKKVARYQERFATLSPAEIKRSLKEELEKGMDFKTGHLVLFALLLDDRNEVLDEGNWFLKKFLSAQKREEIDLEKVKKENEQLLAMLREKDEIKKKLNETIMKLQEENKKLNRAYNELKEEKENLAREFMKLSEQKQPPEEKVEIRHLQKGIEKILYHAEKISKKEEALLNLPEKLEMSIFNQISELKKIIGELMAYEERYLTDLKQSFIEEVKKQILDTKIPVKEEPKKSVVERIAIFVDAENLYHSARECFNGKVSYEKLLSLVVGQNRHLVKAVAYVVKSPERDITAFITVLEKIGFEVKTKEPRYRSDGSAKANWDMGIALDILNLLDKIDTVVLASGDGDFVPLAAYIKSKGKRVEVYSFPKNTAYDLIELADRFYALDEKIAWM